MYVCTAAQMKKAEETAVERGATFEGLMENAGTACGELLCGYIDVKNKNILILCGRGGNGGDGFVMARYLSRRGAAVTVSLLCGTPTGTAAGKLGQLDGSDVRIIKGEETDFLQDYDVIVDAVYGTGFHTTLPENVRNIFRQLDKKKAFKLAVDIPSGINSDSGEVSEGTMHFDLTAALGGIKAGELLYPAKKYCGEIRVLDIGIGEECFAAQGFVPQLMTEERAAVLPSRGEKSHKGKFGKLLIVGGSGNMSGAAALNVKGALRSGAGLVCLASTKRVIDRVGSGVYECTFLELPENDEGAIKGDAFRAVEQALCTASASAVGSGLSVCDDTRELVKKIICLCGEKNIPLILDADGLNCIADCIDIIGNANCRAVLTPHAGELARLTGRTVAEVLGDRLFAAAELSRRTGAVVAAKGVPTYIISPDGRAAVSYTGNGGLSRGGSGDVLTGIISGICASLKGERLFEAVCAGVYIFGMAADMCADRLSMTGMLPSDVVSELPFAFRIIEKHLSEAD